MKTLENMDINEGDKDKLRKEGSKWIKFIKEHIKEVHSNFDGTELYHLGEISFIEFFFNIGGKNGKRNRKKDTRRK